MKHPSNIVHDRLRHTLFAIIFVAASTAHAQTRWEVDPVLNALEGRWTGTVTMEGKTHHCEKVYAWILDNAYLSGTLIVYRDAGLANGLMVEEREFLKPSGENRYSVNRFDSRGVSTWGTYDVAGKNWKYSLKNSDGGGEQGTMTWISVDSVLLEGTISDPAGQVSKSYSVRMQKKE
jgi:hypothetical protein